MVNKKQIKTITIVFAVLITILIVITFIKRDYLSSLLSREIQTYGLILIFFLVAFSEILPQYIGPFAIFVQSLLLGFPVLETIIYSSLGIAVGSFTGFYFGRKYGLSMTIKFYNYEKVQNLEKKMDKYGKWIILLAALTPLPYFPIVFGAIGMKKSSLLYFGIFPRIFGLIVIAMFF